MALVEIAKLPYEEQLLQIERLVDQSRRFPKEFQSVPSQGRRGIQVSAKSSLDAMSLRLRRLKDSIGPDGKDAGGLLNRGDFLPAGSDVGFQLWDPPSRRQPWQAQAKSKTEDDENQVP